MNMRKAMVTFIVCAVATVAMQVNHVGASTIIFQDNFESPSGTTPVAQTGNYTGTPGDVVAIGSAGHPATGSAGETTGNILDAGTSAKTTTGVFTSAVTSGTIRIEYDSMLEAGNTLQMRVLGEDASSTSGEILIRLNSSSTVDNYNGSAYVPTGLTHATGQWQHYVIEYTIGDTSYSLTAGATTVTVNGPFLGVSSFASLDSIQVRRGSGSTDGYYDNVVVTYIPEPGSTALASLGLVFLIAGRRTRKGSPSGG